MLLLLLLLAIVVHHLLLCHVLLRQYLLRTLLWPRAISFAFTPKINQLSLLAGRYVGLWAPETLKDLDKLKHKRNEDAGVHT